MTISENTAAILRSLETLPARAARAVALASDRQNQLTVGHIVRTKLTAAGPQFLNVRTGRLRASARASKTVVNGMRIESAIGSNVRYAGAHEFGFTGTVAVRAFQRRAPQGDKFRVAGAILSRTAAKAAGRLNGKGRAGRGAEQVSSGRAFVKAHSRKMHLPERAMFRTGIAEREGEYRSAIAAALQAAFADKGGAA